MASTVIPSTLTVYFPIPRNGPDRPEHQAPLGISQQTENSLPGFRLSPLKSDGTLWAWGSDEYFQLGEGTATWRSTPVQASGRNKTGLVIFVLALQ